MNVDVTNAPPREYLELVWIEFFADRNRGISLDVHFPWLRYPDTFFVILREGKETVGGLVVRSSASWDERHLAGKVGLVCIDPGFRARGLSRILISAAVEEARRRKIDDLVLWTSKPNLYERHGFDICDEAYYGLVQSTARGAVTLDLSVEDCEEAGVPPFARSVQRFSSRCASVIVIDGDIVARWIGDDAEVTGVLNAIMPDTWRLNALKNDTLPGFLSKAGWRTELTRLDQQMILPLREHDGPRDPYDFRILDRI